MRRSGLSVLTFAAAALLAACAALDGQRAMPASAAAAEAARASATVWLAPTQGNTASGTMNFVATGNDVAVQARVSGLKPNAEHGFHVHEKGDCSAPDATSAGGHFNPHNAPHGPQDAPHHAGDLPALKANANGVAEARFTLKGVSIGSGADDIVGKAVIVHAQPDDYKTQPTGNSGARIACGVIKKS
jgi:superoxide dismutase, Cu-Zn family